MLINIRLGTASRITLMNFCKTSPGCIFSCCEIENQTSSSTILLLSSSYGWVTDYGKPDCQAAKNMAKQSAATSAEWLAGNSRNRYPTVVRTVHIRRFIGVYCIDRWPFVVWGDEQEPRYNRILIILNSHSIAGREPICCRQATNLLFFPLWLHKKPVKPQVDTFKYWWPRSSEIQVVAPNAVYPIYYILCIDEPFSRSSRSGTFFWVLNSYNFCIEPNPYMQCFDKREVNLISYFLSRCFSERYRDRDSSTLTQHGFTTVAELSYTPSQEEKTWDAELVVATGRKTWKTLRGRGEAVWPPIL